MQISTARRLQLQNGFRHFSVSIQYVNALVSLGAITLAGGFSVHDSTCVKGTISGIRSNQANINWCQTISPVLKSDYQKPICNMSEIKVNINKSDVTPLWYSKNKEYPMFLATSFCWSTTLV